MLRSQVVGIRTNFREHLVLRDVDNDGGRLERRQPPPALEGKYDLADPLHRWSLQRGERRLVQGSAVGKPMTELILAYGGTQVRIESLIRWGGRVASRK